MNFVVKSKNVLILCFVNFVAFSFLIDIVISYKINITKKNVFEFGFQIVNGIPALKKAIMTSASSWATNQMEKSKKIEYFKTC